MGFWHAKGKIWACAAALLAASAGIAAADEYHYNSTIIGERPAGMGGAYTAVSDDAAGLYYNPAGTVYSFGSNLSVSANAYTSATKKYDNAGLNFAYERKSENFQPNFFGVVQHTPFGTIGLSYAVQDSLLEDQSQTFLNPTPIVADWTLNYLKEYNIYNVGPSIAWNVSKDLKLGVTLYLHYKKYKVVNNSFQHYADGTHRWSNAIARQDELGYRPILGFIYAPENGKYSVGFSITQTFLFNSSIYVQATEKTPTGTYATDPFFAISRSNDKANYPYTARFGLAYFPTNALLVTGDIAYTSAATDNVWLNREPVVNLSLGAEYYTSPSFAFRAGIFTDRANTKNPATANDPEHIDLFGVSLSGSYFVKGTSVTLGFTDSFGSGSHWINTAATRSGSMTMNSLMVFLGTSYSY